jgi:hypothetical protein
MIKSRRIKWTGHIARTGRRRMHIRFWWESQKEIDHWEYLDVGDRIILKWIIERKDGVVWTGLIWLRIGTNGVPL